MGDKSDISGYKFWVECTKTEPASVRFFFATIEVDS